MSKKFSKPNKDQQDKPKFYEKFVKQKPAKPEKEEFEPRKERKKPFNKKAGKNPPNPAKPIGPDDDIRLNRFIAMCGVCSRREADTLIAEGKIKVNGTVVTEVGTKIKQTDKLTYNGKPLKREKYTYVLLNKPRGYITTTEDPQERRTVMDLVKDATPERIYPVGRLDRNTTGLLLLTNDGELANQLSHPSFEVRKIYDATLNKELDVEDYDKIREGIELEDGPAPVDDIAVSPEDTKVVGIDLHIGRNRIVRRIFEHLGYQVERLDRVMYGELTKKNLPRGKWRNLTEFEVAKLKQVKKKKRKLK